VWEKRATSRRRVQGPTVRSLPSSDDDSWNRPAWTTKPPSASSPALNSPSPPWTWRVSAPIAKMRNAGRPKRPRVGTRSRKAMSSSMAMGAALRHQFVTARFGDQDGRAGGVLLDLLPQPIDVRLQRVSGDAGIIAPHLLQ